ncbi:MAG: FG-GAP repeat domain-containing protein [Planctomycetaceae bacterium]
MVWRTLGVSIVATALASLARGGELQQPVQLEAAGRPIDVERSGHAAPFFGDMDGDGRRDLLVGEYREGRLRIYRNTGSDTQPSFAEYEWFHAGGELGRVPSG